jgi:hypothetical protein
MTRLFAVLAVATFTALAGCGSDDEDSGGGSETAPAAGAETSAATFQAEDVDFTFEIAGDAEQVDEDDGKIVAQVLPDTSQTDDGIRIREAAPQPVAPPTFIATIKSQFESDLDVPVEQDTAEHGGAQMMVLSFDKETGSIDEHVENYFFMTTEKTWQLECISSKPATRETVEELCQTALDTIEFAETPPSW